MNTDLAGWAEAHRASLVRALTPLFSDTWPTAFAEPLRYTLFSEGKRVRPLLCLAAFEAVAPGRSAEAAMPAAIAIELIHTYSLVHDDLPAMDDDDERRGRPTVHIAFGEATAILTGDALLTEAFRVLAEAPLPAEARVACIAELARAAGHLGMVGGQAADVGVGGVPQEVDGLTLLHRKKTGALLECAVVMGGIIGGADAATVERLRRYGAAVGLAFQLADDVLDADEDDGTSPRPSFVRLLGLEATRQRADAARDEALAVVDGLPDASMLVALARYIVERDH